MHPSHNFPCIVSALCSERSIDQGIGAQLKILLCPPANRFLSALGTHVTHKHYVRVLKKNPFSAGLNDFSVKLLLVKLVGISAFSMCCSLHKAIKFDHKGLAYWMEPISYVRAYF